MTIDELLYLCDNIEDIDVTIYYGDEQVYSDQGCDVPEEISYLSVSKYTLELFHSKVHMIIFAE